MMYGREQPVFKTLWFKVLVALVAGIVLGLILSPLGAGLLSEKTVSHLGPWIALPGHLFLALIKMVIIPLILSSIILGITSSGDPHYLKKVSARIFPYFIGTTIVATAIGITLSLIIRPGEYIDPALIRSVMEGSPAAQGTFEAVKDVHLTDRLVGLIPTNYIKSALEKDTLAIVIYAMFIGIALVTIKSDLSAPFENLMRTLQELSLTIINWAMKLAPIAVFGLICNISMRVGVKAVAGMASYVGVVFLGLFLILIFYLVLVFFLGRMSPFQFLKSIREVQLLAFSTSSSAAVMPISMEIAEKKLGVKSSISKFIIPLGATINMDGTSLYQACAAIFLAQVYGIEMSLWTLITLAATTVGASIGTPSTPGVGIVILATILQGIGVPPSGIALILGVDRILDMTRTAVNVTGDLTASVIMNRWLANGTE